MGNAGHSEEARGSMEGGEGDAGQEYEEGRDAGEALGMGESVLTWLVQSCRNGLAELRARRAISALAPISKGSGFLPLLFFPPCHSSSIAGEVPSGRPPFLEKSSW